MPRLLLPSLSSFLLFLPPLLWSLPLASLLIVVLVFVTVSMVTVMIAVAMLVIVTVVVVIVVVADVANAVAGKVVDSVGLVSRDSTQLSVEDADGWAWQFDDRDRAGGRLSFVALASFPGQTDSY